MATRENAPPDDEWEPKIDFESVPDTRFEESYGLEDQIDKLHRTVVNPIEMGVEKHSEVVCFDGPYCAGKTWLAEATAGELAANDFSYYAVDSYPDVQNEYPAYVAAVLNRAKAAEPSIVHFEDYDRLTMSDETAILTHIMDCLNSDASVLVFLELGEVTHQANGPVADVYVNVPEPDKHRLIPLFKDRLCEFVTSVDCTIEFGTIDFDAIVEELEWCRPGDLDPIISRIYDHTLEIGSNRITQGCIQRGIEEKKQEIKADPMYPTPDEFAEDPHEPVNNDHAASQFRVENLSTTFDDIGGLDPVIQRIREVLLVPREHPEFFEGTTLTSTNGILLHGPPGNGKTLLARALANEMDRSFFSVRGPELKNKWFGESEQEIRELFQLADENEPSLIFFDEFDAIAPDRNGCQSSPTTSCVNMLLTEMDGLDQRGDIVYLATTNRKDALDDAVLRAGRIDETIEISEPDADARGEIFAVHSSNLPTDAEVTPEWFIEASPDGISGAKIESICRHAAHAAIRESDEQPTIERKHVQQAMEGGLLQ